MEIILCSSCLLGINCRYDGSNSLHQGIIDFTKKAILIAVCPEQLGGLPTPRPPAEILVGRVITKKFKNITEEFRKGAYEVLKIAKLYGIKKAILKSNSPSCGTGSRFDGSFSGKLIDGDGVTTNLLKKNGIFVISENDDFESLL